MARKIKRLVVLKRDYLAAFIISAIFILDRIAKTYLVDSCFWIFCINRVVNNGAAFGILPGQTILLVVVAIGVLILIATSYRESDLLGKVGLSLIAAGTISNMFDRIFYGHVLDVFTVWRSSSFNLADLSNLIGVILFVASLYTSLKPRKR